MKKGLDLRTAPTGLRREHAAMHCGVSAPHFDKLVKSGVFPPPRLAGGTVKLWMRQDLDVALFSLPEAGEQAESNPCDRLLE
jgi:predicted DNA-binding transcriptional regulator AlpA